jgi:hypothetical protein
MFARRELFLRYHSRLNIPRREPLQQHPMDEHVAAADFAKEDAVGVGSASPLAGPTFGVSVSFSLLECGYAEPQVAVLAVR